MLALLLHLAALVPADADAFVASGPGEGQPVGRLVTLSADGTAELGTANGNTTVRDVVSLRRAATVLPPPPRGPVLLTTAGDRIPGRLVGGDDSSLRFQTSLAAGPWDVPLSAVTVAWLTRAPADTPTDPARYSWLPEARKRDLIYFRNGDTLTGTLDGFAAGAPAVRLKPDAGEVRTVALGPVAAVAFNPTLARFRRPKGPFARLVLRDGTRLAVVGATADADTLKAKTTFGQPVTVPLAELVSLDVMQGKGTYLADLKPKAVEQAGFLGTAWPWAADRTVRGTPLRLLTSAGVSTFDRGLGTHPRTALTYDLAGKYQRFEALVGLDAAAGERGRAVVRVLVDGKEQPLPHLANLAYGPAAPVRVDVRGATALTLVVDFGPNGDVRADVNWADARLME